MLTIKKGNSTFSYNTSCSEVKINGMTITGWAYDETVRMFFTHHKFKPRSSRQELFVKDTPEGRKIFTDISTIMEKDVDIVPSKEGWLRVRPAFNDKEVKMIKNYLKMVEEV